MVNVQAYIVYGVEKQICGAVDLIGEGELIVNGDVAALLVC